MENKEIYLIENLLRSGDKEKMKLGQKICHHLRIPYFIECLPYKIDESSDKHRRMYTVVGMSLYNIDKKIITQMVLDDGWKIRKTDNDNNTYQKVYKIELNAKRIKT